MIRIRQQQISKWQWRSMWFRRENLNILRNRNKKTILEGISVFRVLIRRFLLIRLLKRMRESSLLAWEKKRFYNIDKEILHRAIIDRCMQMFNSNNNLLGLISKTQYRTMILETKEKMNELLTINLLLIWNILNNKSYVLQWIITHWSI
jgi:hypothetical protein